MYLSAHPSIVLRTSQHCFLLIRQKKSEEHQNVFAWQFNIM